jgi:hypothetical protein
MNSPKLMTALLAVAASLTLSGCAVFSEGRSQSVVVRSAPAGAVAKINGVEVGRTPFEVKLARTEVYRFDFEKPGFGSQTAVVLPSTEQYDQRFLRWGIDYDLGAAATLLPGELVVELKPQLAELSLADRFAEMAAQINRADAMLVTGELTREDHIYLVQQITDSYHPKL